MNPSPSGNPTRQAFIGVGANLGDRWATIRHALDELAKTPGITALERSAIFETAPVGITDQPVFLNLVIGVETTLTPEELLTVLLARERAAGRDRTKEMRWGPRTLDLDLLLYEYEERNGPGLILPHPRLWERSFVLVPLKDLLGRSQRFDQPCWTPTLNRINRLNILRNGLTQWTPPQE
jgi:2-amino-4-hydroxy-6-hydroxymethyldihydropteridine diphosphokinase